jgi:hypothetical protein
MFLVNWTELSWPVGTIPNFILERNYDPGTLLPSHTVNGVLYTAIVGPQGYGPCRALTTDVVEIAVDPLAYGTAVAEKYLNFGRFYTGLSADDVGGLRYLLSASNINYEVLLSDVYAQAIGVEDGHGKGKGHGKGHGRGHLKGRQDGDSGAIKFINGALRPGMEKITFVRQNYDGTGQEWVPLTYQFTDSYITNGAMVHQELERVVSQPDIVFFGEDQQTASPCRPIYRETGTDNWWNGAESRGSAEQGPGIIRPPVGVTFTVGGQYFGLASKERKEVGTLG